MIPKDSFFAFPDKLPLIQRVHGGRPDQQHPVHDSLITKPDSPPPPRQRRSASNTKAAGHGLTKDNLRSEPNV
jgi:hypothetical protein